MQNGTVVQTDTHAVTEHFDLTAQVPGGRLYGGAFSAEACGADSVQSFAAGQNAMDFTPEAGATYYIWEPSDVYLAPRNYNVWQHVYGSSNGERGVIATYLLTTIDRTLYQEVGFLSGSSSYASEKDGASIAYGVVNANKGSELYQQLYVWRGELNATTGINAETRDDGYIGLYRWTDSAFSFGALPGEDASGSVQTAAPAAQDSQTDRRDVPEEYHEIYNKLKGVGCSTFMFPAYIPDGFQVTETKLHSNANDENVKFVMLYEDGTDYLIFQVSHGGDSSFPIYEKDSQSVEIYNQNDIDYYIFTNLASLVSVWSKDHTEYSVSTTLSLPALKEIIDSVFEEVIEQ